MGTRSFGAGRKCDLTRPYRTNRDDRYFTDTYQAMPLHGYTRMFENMLDHSNIKIMLNCDYREIEKEIPFREMIYTGPVDTYFDYCYGKLPYRSLEFKHETHDTPVYQSRAGRQLSERTALHRVTEFKYLTGQEHTKTSVVYEFPKAQGDPYYPVPRKENARALCEIQGACGCDSGGALCRTTGNLQVLQHGPDCGAGANSVCQDSGHETSGGSRSL